MDFDKLIDALYRGFILRDVFGKMAPAALGLISLALLFPRLIVLAFWPGEFLGGGLIGDIVTGGLLWILGLCVQALGEACGRTVDGRGGKWRFGLCSYPKPSSDATRGDFEVRRGKFEGLSDEEGQKRQRERLVVIKEATGNTAFAIYFALVVALGLGLLHCLHDLPFPPEEPDRAAFFVLLLAGAAALLHFKHDSARREQALIEINALESLGAERGLSTSQADEMRANADLPRRAPR